MGCLKYVMCVLLFSPMALTRHDDDFAFDNNDEFQVDLHANHSEIAKTGLKRLWGVPDTTAYVGYLFRMEIPKEAFSGDVLAYKVRNENGRRTPNWLAVDTKHGLISGIPQEKNLGSHTFLVTAHGRTQGLTASDVFTIEVKKADEKPNSKYGVCRNGENKLVLLILVDGSFELIAPRQKIRALMELSRFMALHAEEFWMSSYSGDVRAHSVLMSGGTPRSATSALGFQVGCGEKLWSRHKVLVAGIREQVRDGTLNHVTGLSVLGWRLVSIKPTPRPKRHSEARGWLAEEGSGADDAYDAEDNSPDYSGYGDDDDDDDYSRVDVVPDTHSEDKIKITPYSENSPEASSFNISQVPLPTDSRRLDGGHSPVVIVPEDITTSTEPELQTVIIRASNEIPTLSSTEPPTSASPTLSSSTIEVNESSTSTSTTSTTPSTTSTTSTTTLPPTTSPSTTPIPETTIPEVTVQETVTSTERTSTIIGRTTETVTFAIPANQPPTLKHHMKKLAITAGKAFRYIIPADLFTDPEDGSNLTFTMYEGENAPLSKNSWIQFISAGREVYGLPLESHVSRWNFIVEAQDSEGLSARGPLDITVQQHKSARTINHQFIMNFKLNKEYPNAIDWQIKALEGIVNLFRDTDMDHLTVLNATQNGDTYEFVWTNDTLPKDAACPLEDIKRLMKILESDTEMGHPSESLSIAMSPVISVTNVSWRGERACAAPAAAPPDTYPPVPRNQVDHVTATAGHLLVLPVPEDTFFDPEDGGTRNLALSLRFSDRSELGSSHWLQFDAKNQEFYGLPLPSDIGSVHYQLIAEDSSKKSAYDSLIVEVVKAPTIKPTVEFQMTLEYPYQQLAYNANVKRKVVEKLAELFGQKGTDNIRIQSISDNPTTIIWYNTSLPMDRCPRSEIAELRKTIIADERDNALRENVDVVFDKDFKVMAIRMIPLGLCSDHHTKTAKPIVPVHTGSSGIKANADGGYTEYMVTFVIPVVVIVCMLMVAGVIACILYRRRRTGKMSVGDEEERQAFRSKGIPVIFQEELEERGEAEETQTRPVILREEKPPLGGECAPPYRPPPPFAAPAPPAVRARHTPSYRKPPPYVPP